MKKIFIGSSSEGKDILEMVELKLKEEYEIIRWDKSMIANRSTLDCLIENAIIVDEAIFIGTADNTTIATDSERAEREGTLIKHRDNVVFEFGLFLGMLGRHDCVYLVENSTLKDLMTDYNGINVITFDKNNLESSLLDAVMTIKNIFNDYSSRDINLFPSASLAAAYFKNFLQPIFNHYLYNKSCIVVDKKRKYHNCSVTIILPATITDDVNAQFDEIKRTKKITTSTCSIEYIGRERKVTIDSNAVRDELKIIDFPTIIAGIYNSVYSLLPYEKHKTFPNYSAIMSRELKRFEETLQLFIKDASCRGISVSIVQENDLSISSFSKKCIVKKLIHLNK